MGRIRFPGVELALAAALCLVAAVVHQANLQLEERAGDEPYDGTLGPLPDGKAVRVLALGFDRLVADLFWLRTVNYVGDERAERAGYPAAADLAELVTDIDPGFRTAYSVMNTVLTMLVGDPDSAIALLEKGVRHIDWWRLHFLQGFNYFYYRNDFARGAEEIRLASLGDRAPPYLPRLAARLYASAGETDTALAFIRARIDQAETELERRMLVERARDLWITRDLRRLDRAIEAYTAARGAAPRDVRSLVAAGLLPEEPRDPDGGAYRIENGKAATSLEFDDLRVHFNRGGDPP